MDKSKVLIPDEWGNFPKPPADPLERIAAALERIAVALEREQYYSGEIKELTFNGEPRTEAPKVMALHPKKKGGKK